MCTSSMFRIIKFRLPEGVVNDVVERDAFKMFVKECECLQLHEDCYFTKAMATTSSEFFACERLLCVLLGDPSIFIDDMSARYQLLRTRAPQSYDYEYVIEIAKTHGEFGQERLVALPREHVAYQSGRYASGLYSPISCS